MMDETSYESKRDAFLELYKVSNDLVGAAKAIGLNTLSAYKILKITGAMSVNDRLKYGTAATKMGAHAEIEFKKLVPKSVPMNADDHIHKGYDFTVGGVTVDVKSSSLCLFNDRKSKVWTFKIQRGQQKTEAKGADFYVLFVVGECKKISNGYGLYVLPSELLNDLKTITITESNLLEHWISDFKIDPSELAAFFEDITDDDGVVEGAYTGKPYQFKKVKEKFLSGRRDWFHIDLHNITRMRQKIARMCAA